MQPDPGCAEPKNPWIVDRLQADDDDGSGAIAGFGVLIRSSGKQDGGKRHDEKPFHV